MTDKQAETIRKLREENKKLKRLIWDYKAAKHLVSKGFNRPKKRSMHKLDTNSIISTSISKELTKSC